MKGNVVGVYGIGKYGVKPQSLPSSVRPRKLELLRRLLQRLKDRDEMFDVLASKPKHDEGKRAERKEKIHAILRLQPDYVQMKRERREELLLKKIIDRVLRDLEYSIELVRVGLLRVIERGLEAVRSLELVRTRPDDGKIEGIPEREGGIT